MEGISGHFDHIRPHTVDPAAEGTVACHHAFNWGVWATCRAFPEVCSTSIGGAVSVCWFECAGECFVSQLIMHMQVRSKCSATSACPLLSVLHGVGKAAQRPSDVYVAD